MSAPERLSVFFDYLCPYAWRGAELCELLEGKLELEVHWHHFSVEENRPGRGGQHQLWNARVDPEDASGGRGLLPFLASCAARRQGAAAYRGFRLAALRAHHQQGLPYTRAVLFGVAEAVGLHLPSFERDFDNPERRTMLANEHHQALLLNVRRSPTFRFASGQMAQLRLGSVPTSPDAAVGLFRACRDLLEHHPDLEGLERVRCRCN